MTNVFFAQPYNIDATGFYFSTREEFAQKSENAVDAYGQPVEEYELQIIDCDHATLFKGEIQLDDLDTIDKLDDLDKWDLDKIYFLASESYSIKQALDNLEDCTIYDANSFADLARDFVNEGYYGDLKTLGSLANYIDYDSLGRDLSLDGYATFTAPDGSTKIGHMI